MWLVITYFADPCLNPSINFCCLVIMFYPKKKSCSVDVLKFWKYNFLLVLLADAVRGCGEGMAKQRENRESREGFLLPEYSGKGHTKRGGYQTASIMWESDKVRWQMRWYPGREQKIGDESSVRYKISLPEMKLPSPRTDPSSSASPGLNRRAHWAVSACQHQSPQHLNHSYSGTIQYPVHEKYYCYDSE